jgi:PAS domain S-box-containing protein
MQRALSSLDILAHITDAVIAIDLEGRVLFWNEGAERLYGWAAKESLGRSAQDFLKTRFVDPANSGRPVESMVDSLLRDGRWQGELTRVKQTGEPIEVLSRWTVLRDEFGTSIGRLIIDTDLTETQLRRHEMRLAEERALERDRIESVLGDVYERPRNNPYEQKLALSENRYRSLVRASTQIVWTTTAEGVQMGNLPEWQAFTGQTHEQVIGTGWADAIHPEDREDAIQGWQESIRSGKVHDSRHRLRKHDGEYRVMAVRAVPVRDAGGKILEWVGTHTDITEQTAALEEARLAHEQLQLVMDSITDGICVIDRDWRYTFFNENGARICGLRVADILGQRVGDVFKGEKSSAFDEHFRAAVETGEPVHFESFLGAPLNKWMECHCYPSSRGLTVYFRDITERKRTEHALRASESRFRKLFESDLMGIGIPDRFGAFSEGNNELLRMVGYTREELDAGLVRWDTMTPPEYAQIDIEHIAEAAKRGSCTPYEKEYIRKDGSRVPILCGYALLEGSQDEYVGFVLDLSRQKAAEAGLREREERFRLLAEGIPQFVWLTDPVGSITFLNARFIEYVGIAQEAVNGFDWTSILHPEEQEQTQQRWTRSVETGEPYTHELRMRGASGSYRYFLASALAMRDDAGNIARWVGSCTDIHDQKLAEEALRRSEKLAATGRLAASIAHEINNPLEAVTNSLYLALADENLSEQTRSFLKMADQELARVAHITTQTLRFHRQSKSARNADLSEIMESVLGLFAPRMNARQITIEKELAPGANFHCLEDELRQVFANLVSNSLDATADGGRIRVRVRKSSGDRVQIIVADTGSGIPAAVVERIFEPFFSTKDATGIGLGLWVSDGIIRKHKGRIRVRTSQDSLRHGTIMSVIFPAE